MLKKGNELAFERSKFSSHMDVDKVEFIRVNVGGTQVKAKAQIHFLADVTINIAEKFEDTWEGGRYKEFAFRRPAIHATLEDGKMITPIKYAKKIISSLGSKVHNSSLDIAITGLTVNEGTLNQNDRDVIMLKWLPKVFTELKRSGYNVNKVLTTADSGYSEAALKMLMAYSVDAVQVFIPGNYSITDVESNEVDFYKRFGIEIEETEDKDGVAEIFSRLSGFIGIEETPPEVKQLEKC
jgi:hypothetical protein